MRRKWWAIGASAILLLMQGVGSASVKAPPKEFSNETKECVACHKKNNPGIVQQWGDSKHYRAKVGCYTSATQPKKVMSMPTFTMTRR